MSFYLAVFSVWVVPGVFGSLGNWEPDLAETTTFPTINFRASTYVITTDESASETTTAGKLPPLPEDLRVRLEQLTEERKLNDARWQRHKAFSAKCQVEKYVKIQDELGCEMCTCIYEKSIMLCSPYQCVPRDSALRMEELGASLYHDYVINVPTHFSEYKCKAGDVMLLSALCECTCVAKDVISCPANCNFGRPLY